MIKRWRSKSGAAQSAASPQVPSSLGAWGGGMPRGTSALLAAASLTVTAVGMHSIRGILAPVLLTLILTICANPVRTYLQAKGVPQGIATGSVILVMFALLAAFALTVTLAVRQFVAMLPRYADEFDAIGRSLGQWLSSLGVSKDEVEVLIDGIAPANILGSVLGAIGGVASLVGALVIVLTMIILMSADAVYVPTILRQLRERRPHTVTALELFAPNVRRYMVVTTLLGVAQGALNTVALWMLQVPAALLWGLLAFLCSFVPNVGYFVAIIPPLVFGFLVGGWPTVLIIVVVYGVINAVVQSIVQPRVVGQAVSLSQTVTFFSVLFWAVVIGPIGAILAIPLTLLGKMLLVDADPEARLWRPAFGPTSETRQLKESQDTVRARKSEAAKRSKKSPDAALTRKSQGAERPRESQDAAPILRTQRERSSPDTGRGDGG